MKYLALLLLLSCNMRYDYKMPAEKEYGYTVRFITKGDTSYLLNSEPLTYKEAKETADGYKKIGFAEPVIFDSVYKPRKYKTLPHTSTYEEQIKTN